MCGPATPGPASGRPFTHHPWPFTERCPPCRRLIMLAPLLTGTSSHGARLTCAPRPPHPHCPPLPPPPARWLYVCACLAQKVAAGYVLHVGELKGKVAVGDTVRSCVDYVRRGQIKPNHTMTHVLNYALKWVRGGLFWCFSFCFRRGGGVIVSAGVRRWGGREVVATMSVCVRSCLLHVCVGTNGLDGRVGDDGVGMHRCIRQGRLEAPPGVPVPR